jgi:hypothetical protein
MVVGLSFAASIIIAAAGAGEGQPSSSDIPSSLRGFMDCMVKTAKSAPFEYRGSDSYGEYEAVADYYDQWTDAPLVEKMPTFTSTVSGLRPACDKGLDGKPNCGNVRSWEAARRAHGPIPGWGTPEVTRAWENTCGVRVFSLSL